MGRASGKCGKGQKYIHVKRRLGLPRRSLEDNIKIALKNKMGWSGLDESGSEGGEMAVCCEERK
jgi:hypothetical protein